MANLLKTGADWLAGQLEDHASEVVEYVRGTAVCSLKAARGSSDFESLDEFGGAVLIRSVDFLVRRSRLDLGEGETEPAVGDLVIVCEGQKTVTYEVTPFGPNQQHFRPSDQNRQMWRIHTQRVIVAGG